MTTEFPTEHLQVHSDCLNVPVDANILQLIEKINSCGVRTLFSCEGSRRSHGYVSMDANSGYEYLLKNRSLLETEGFKILQTYSNMIPRLKKNSFFVAIDSPDNVVTFYFHYKNTARITKILENSRA